MPKFVPIPILFFNFLPIPILDISRVPIPIPILDFILIYDITKLILMNPEMSIIVIQLKKM